MSRALVITLPLLLLLCGSREASAHRFAAGVLEVRGNRHDVLVTLSAPSAAFDALQIKLPARCRTHGKGQLRSHDKTRSSAQRYRCSGAGIVGATLRLDGLGSANVSVVARLDILGATGKLTGAGEPTLLTAAAPTLRIGRAAAGDRLQAAARYLRLGVEHILLGVDHLAFVACLLLLVGRDLPRKASARPTNRRRLLQTITAFTLGHSVTLSLAATGALSLAPAPTEALIALSIVLLAREALRARSSGGDGEQPSSLAQRRPWLVAASFGLLHGLGFAGALGEIGLAPDAVLVSLASFNLGVELGQIVFVVVALGVVALLPRVVKAARSPRLARVVLVALGTLAGYWLAERVVAVCALA